MNEGSASFTYEGRLYSFKHEQGDHIAKWWEAGLFYEQPLLEAIRDEDLVGIYLDVGAHVGNHTIYFATQCPAVQVEAFEPWDASHGHLCANLSANITESTDTEISVHKAIVGNSGQRKMVPPPAGNSGMAKSMATTSTRDGQPSHRLCNYANGPERVALIKIDVEGDELRVIAGCHPLLREHRPMLVMEAATGRALYEQEQALSRLYRRRSKQYGKTPTYIWDST